MHQRDNEDNLLEAKFWVVPPFLRASAYPAATPRPHCPRFPRGAFEEQRTSQSELLMSAICAGGGLRRAADACVRADVGGRGYGGANIHELGQR